MLKNERAQSVATLDDFEWDIELPNYQRLETVLVIEDNTALNRAITIRLQQAGLNVANAHDGLSGLDKVHHLEPDLILLDLNLPRLHGVKLLHRLRMQPNAHRAPVIVMTGTEIPELEGRLEAFGIRQVFPKPVELKQVVRASIDVLNDA